MASFTRSIICFLQVDRCYGWDTHADSDIRTALKSQSRATMDEIDTRTKQIRTQLMERGLNAEVCIFQRVSF